MTGDKNSLGKFHLVRFPPAPRGLSQVEVTFDIDENGILNVSQRQQDCKRDVHDVALIGSSAIPIVQMVLSSLHTETAIPMNWDGGTA